MRMKKEKIAPLKVSATLLLLFLALSPCLVLADRWHPA